MARERQTATGHAPILDYAGRRRREMIRAAIPSTVPSRRTELGSGTAARGSEAKVIAADPWGPLFMAEITSLKLPSAENMSRTPGMGLHDDPPAKSHFATGSHAGSLSEPQGVLAGRYQISLPLASTNSVQNPGANAAPKAGSGT